MSTMNRISKANPALAAKITQMALPLAPLVRLTTGKIHPSFPKQLLNFWLLTSEELDELAHFYHQRTPCEWTSSYPCPVKWDVNAGLEVKRMRLGRFIGLKGCESPVETVEEIESRVRSERAKRAEEETWRNKNKWY
ncbi:4426f4e0-653f-4f24-a2b9-b524b47cdbd7 [Sclerotinia trifoliorum]|uniref:4426f4e0-653f-4f24-a2b9-b524b47cdbd7 n=1 Tax=Sclerotinia trifoliorum TaxID=28548 RepID=A0A8H2VZN9_9HELO|nr:4426f4e0-653f-4f24-a2b9-b524b47cdbd7 [Sclerotinia trifoliorum]